MDTILRSLERAYHRGDPTAQFQHERHWRLTLQLKKRVHFVDWIFHSRLRLKEEIDFPATHLISMRCGRELSEFSGLRKTIKLHFSKYEEFVTCETCKKAIASLKKMWETHPAEAGLTIPQYYAKHQV